VPERRRRIHPRPGTASRTSAGGWGFGFEVSGIGRSMSGYLERKIRFPWREASPPDHLDNKVDSDQYVVCR
jgi:hypothetical protein